MAISPRFAAAFYNRGATRYELSDRQGALDDYNRAIEIDPEYSAAYYSRDRQVTITQPTIATAPSEHRSRRERSDIDRQPVFDRAMPSQQFHPERGRSEAAPNIPDSDRHRSRQR